MFLQGFSQNLTDGAPTPGVERPVQNMEEVDVKLVSSVIEDLGIRLAGGPLQVRPASS